MNHFQIESQALAIREEIIAKFPQHMTLLRNVRMRASNRTTRALGTCRFRNGVPFEIVISHNAFQHEANVSEFRDTVLHEIAHAIAGSKAGHGWSWKLVATQVGATPQRCSTGLAVSPVQYVTLACYVCQGAIKASTRQAAKAKRGARYRHSTCRPQGVKFYRPLSRTARRMQHAKRAEAHMAHARSTLEALVWNDPEHPAIRTFVVAVQVAVDLPSDDTLKVEAIKQLVKILERRLTSG